MAYVKANPDKLNYASQGPGTTSHLTAELFNKLAGTKLVHVPYKGTGPALIDIAAGHVDLIFMQLEAAIKLHEGGKARILAVTTEKRIAALPDIPTMGEAGLKDFISDTWNAISAPPKTPAPIVAKLNAAVNDVLKMPEVQEQYRKQLLQLGGGTPQDLAKVMKEDTARWSEVIREAEDSADLGIRDTARPPVNLRASPTLFIPPIQCAGNDADGLVLARGADRLEIIVGGDAADSGVSTLSGT